jgi:hypothetical protein
MVITSAGIFGYLSSAYQINASKNVLDDSKIALLEQQKQTVNDEIQQIQGRINTLNEARKAQEARLPSMSSRNARLVYEDIKQSSSEIKTLTERLQALQVTKFDNDKQVITIKTDVSAANDIGTFKFVAKSFNAPLDDVVKTFILVLVSVFDPLSVSLVLALNIAVTGKMVKETKEENKPTTRNFIFGNGSAKQK